MRTRAPDQAGAESVSDVVTELERLMRGDVLAKLGADPSGELAAKPFANLLIVYLNWRARFIPVRRRQIYLSAELQASPKYLQHQAATDVIAKKIQAGADLTPHLSRRVTSIYEPHNSRSPKNQRRTDLDLLVAEWGIHHLHLTTDIEADRFVRRTDDLLFAVFQPDDAFLIAIFPHGSWTKSELATITVRNWPDADVFHELRGVIGLAQTVGETDRPLLRNAGLTTALDIDGKVYIPSGQSTAGTPIAATMTSNQTMHALHSLRDTLNSRPEELADKIRDAGFLLEGSPTWKAYRHEGWYGVREEHTGAFLPRVPSWE